MQNGLLDNRTTIEIMNTVEQYPGPVCLTMEIVMKNMHSSVKKILITHLFVILLVKYITPNSAITISKILTSNSMFDPMTLFTRHPYISSTLLLLLILFLYLLETYHT